jgi:hypothetical protein
LYFLFATVVVVIVRGGHESFVGVEKKESTYARSMGFGVIGFCFKMSGMRIVRL